MKKVWGAAAPKPPYFYAYDAKNVQECRKRENLAILFENNLVLRTSQQSLVKWVWDFSKSVAASTVTHPGAQGPVSMFKRSGFGPRFTN